MGELERIAEKLKNSGCKYALNASESNSRGAVSPSHNQNYAIAEKLKASLLKEYRGKDLLEETNFEVIDNRYGETFHLKEFTEKTFQTPDTAISDILSDLKLVYGIGKVREEELKNDGYETILDLLDHQKWGEGALEVNEAFQGDSPAKGYNLLRRWKNLSHPSFIRLSGLYDRKDFAIVDIETLGLSNQPIFLLGLAQPTDSGVEVHQFLASNPGREMATIVQFVKKLENLEVILTYNGKNFDLPYIERRLAYYGQRKKFSHPHLDLYLFTRKFLSDRTRNCQLGTIESSILGIERKVDIPSALVPEFYNTYRKNGNPGPLIPILAHNRQDLLSLADLYRVIIEEALNGNP
ncbi:ribonuclease H-like domain-containing protein [Candidatus Bipolaricaulota bacterium]|nr:ribonuclease H-like domain-containing protein [Candidatus Bipolaricaulota bacterium]